MTKNIPNESIVKSLVKVCIKFKTWAQKRDPSYLSIVRGRKEFKEEFCTFHLGLPRRGGNTTTALELLKAIEDSVFITLPSYVEDIQHRVPSSGIADSSLERCFSVTKIKGLKASAVVVDLASMMSEAQIKKVYSINSECFFFFG